MKYTLTASAAAHRMFKKLPVEVKNHLLKTMKEVQENPKKGEVLGGKLSRYRSLHTIYRRTHYRVLYYVDNRLKEIMVMGAGTRENFYRQLKKMKLKSL